MQVASPLEPTPGNDTARLLAEEEARSTQALELVASGRHTEALQVYQQSLDIKIATVGPNHATLGPLHSKMASIYKTQGKPADALVSYEKTLEVATINFGAGHKNVGELAPPHAPFPTLLLTCCEWFELSWSRTSLLTSSLIAMRMPPFVWCSQEVCTAASRSCWRRRFGTTRRYSTTKPAWTSKSPQSGRIMPAWSGRS